MMRVDERGLEFWLKHQRQAHWRYSWESVAKKLTGLVLYPPKT
jgi:hypothetical protein